MIKTVIKRDGREQEYSAAKLNDWGIWAAKDLDPKIVNWSSVILKVVSTLPEVVTAKQLQDALIKECVDRDTFEHQKMAGRLYASSLPKNLYEERDYPHIKDLHKKMIEDGAIVKPNYSASEYKKINKMLRHELDLTYAYYSLHQIVTRYALQNRKTKKIYESPQFVYMRVAMQALNSYKEADRMQKLKDMYDLMAERKINIPTPYYSNSLTSNPNVASCALVAAGDSAESIGAMNALMYALTCTGAGIGSHSSIRSLGDEVRGGLIKHEGIVPYLKMFGATIKSSKQGCLPYEIEVLVEGKGWIPIGEYQHRDKIFARSSGQTYSFVEPRKFWKYDHSIYGGELYHFRDKNGKIDFKVTPAHKVIWYKEIGNRISIEKTKAEDLVNKETLPEYLFFMVMDDSVQESDVTEGMKFSIGDLNEGKIHFVKIHKNDLIIEKEEYKEDVYCFSIEGTEEFVIRHNGKIVTTGNSRGGSATHYVPFYNPEIITILNLKNPMTPIAKRVRELDYGVNLNKWFLQKAAKNENVYLFSVKDAPELDELFYSKMDAMEWGAKVEAFAKANPDKIQEIPAQEILKETLKQSLEVGRIYLHFVDEANRHTPYKEPIRSSNLCAEVENPTKPFKNLGQLYSKNLEDSEMGIVAFCNLAGILVDNIESDEEYAKAAYYCLFMIDSGIENSNLTFPALNAQIRAYRSAGVGILGLAHLMAEKGLSYRSKEGKEFIHELAETHAYHLYKAALQLGKERGNAEFMNRTKFPEGWLPIDTYNKSVDDIVSNNLKRDWEGLRKEIIENKGIRFCTVCNIPPAESSSVASETTNSVYPLRDLTVVKTSGSTASRWVAPNASKLKDKYEIVWNIPAKDIIEMYAILQKFIDQGISSDLWVDRSKVGNVKMSTLMQEVFWMSKYGLKSRYYYNSKTEADVDLTKAAIADVTKATTVNQESEQEDEGYCESCTL